MRRMFVSAILCLPVALVAPALANESDALAISANIRSRHMPFGTVLNPIYSSATSTKIVGYTRCGDSALWTGAYLAAESYRYNVTQSPDALNNVKAALAGLKSLVDVTGDNRLARCVVDPNSPYAAGIEMEEAHNTIHHAGSLDWVDNTSRDEVVGAYFGLGVAYDLVNDAGVKAGVSDLATRMLAFISTHQWSPNDDVSNTFQLRPEELQMLLQTTHHINPAATIPVPLIVLPVNVAVLVDVLSNSSYFKFNLDYMTFYNLLRLQNNGANLGAYQTVRDYTASHQNAFFDMVDRVLQGPNASRDAEAVSLLDQWLQRPVRDFSVDLSKTVAVCGTEACQPVPVPLRPPNDFLWQADPFQLTGGGTGLIEGAGIDYILPYWMARYYALIQGIGVQSAAALSSAVAPNSIASIYGSNLAAAPAQAQSQPLPITLGGVALSVTDSTGTARPAPLIYVSPTQINFVVPDGTAPGRAAVSVSGAGTQTNTTVAVQPVAPTLFSVDGSGSGVAAATALLVQVADPNLRGPLPVFTCTSAGCAAVPLRLGVDTLIYVSFYGTGIRNLSSPGNVSVTINGVSAPVQYAGPAPGFAGLDQVNVLLPLTLRGAGQSNVVLTVDGQSSNTVTIDVQ